MMTRKYEYDKEWWQIMDLLNDAEAEMSKHKLVINDKTIRMRVKAKHMRAFKGLQGVTNGLRWVLGDKDMTTEEVLGRSDR
tara:strand:+ start:1391 stop:1633 length:243 start_codon:yes stop_codon:yes gene_type:complete